MALSPKATMRELGGPAIIGIGALLLWLGVFEHRSTLLIAVAGGVMLLGAIAIWLELYGWPTDKQ